MKVSKFGGTSVASGNQIEQLANIISADPERRIVVVSAPGKRDDSDLKVTDMLITLGEKRIKGESVEDVLAQVVERYRTIAQELGVEKTVMENIEADLQARAAFSVEDEGVFMDQIKAAGEDNNAKLIAAYFHHTGMKASYMNPREAGLLVSGEAGNAQVLDDAYESLAELKDRKEILVFPGFFGYKKDGQLVTFPRGGSDITGAIVAAGVNAELYENFTDVDSVCVANPKVIDNPEEIQRMTYREMRELSYAGFAVFHDVALIPAFRHGIPVKVKNTNNPEGKGTLITAEKSEAHDLYPITGIAADSGFSIIYVRKYLMNREVGFGRRLLEMVEDEGISYEHLPSGIDDTSVVLRTSEFSLDSENRLLTRIQTEMDVDDAYIEHGFTMLMLVGEGMKETVGIAAQATKALSKVGINIEMINQGPSEVSLAFAVKERVGDEAIKAIYDEFYAKQLND
ncbi:aspartate kinase [Salicibibacter halophilus]|uniref:Aspartokinase n=1 Tax=Salicibibacter halophilus TaxID=2502791 RepID=A0A514LGF6_9BACI|nr:aspartate kinase [Salicibibacter halophilus]QDI90625.1 aspartate kinase [Salicibibacter halophilus]